MYKELVLDCVVASAFLIQEFAHSWSLVYKKLEHLLRQEWFTFGAAQSWEDGYLLSSDDWFLVSIPEEVPLFFSSIFQGCAGN